MISVAAPAAAGSHRIRRLDVGRDLSRLADLIEVAFAADLSETGNNIVAEFRQLAQAGPLLWVLTSVSPLAPLEGLVWEEQGRILGNVGLSLESKRLGLWTISNVAVHPNHRGRGIGRQLMEAAIAQARRRSARLLFLEVRSDNVVARTLYERSGFVCADTVHEMGRDPNPPSPPAEPGCLRLRPRRGSDAVPLFRLSDVSTVAPVRQFRPLSPDDFRFDALQVLARFLEPVLSFSKKSDWVAEDAGGVYGLLRVTGQYDSARHRISMVVDPERRGTVERQLVAAALHILQRFPPRAIAASASISHPQAIEAFQSYGFTTVRALDQMYLRLSRAEGAG